MTNKENQRLQDQFQMATVECNDLRLKLSSLYQKTSTDVSVTSVDSDLKSQLTLLQDKISSLSKEKQAVEAQQAEHVRALEAQIAEERTQATIETLAAVYELFNSKLPPESETLTPPEVIALLKKCCKAILKQMT
jgi:hypothetical protein